MRTAICPGSFDPITNGHLDVIERAANLFDEVVVVVMTNYRKKGNTTFSETERAELIKKAVSDIPNVKVDTYDGLLADYARKHNIGFAVKGLRAVSDFEDEFQQAIGNRHLNNNLETVFIASKAENMFLSSSMVRQIGELGGDISKFVPDVVLEDVKNRLLRKD
ncbi:MAG: pantetheine-phosphate adenylyltransferase [Oscillospiraceae bacterium]|nr:pantetheine-phosphate adenylyltransferase [Oscillospiraceae bacterium]